MTASPEIGPTTAPPPAVEMIAITRRCPRVVANDAVSIRVEPGEIYALVGENGAGKSTLMNVLYGLYQPDSGEIRVHGQTMRFRSPADAIAAGIGMVHQHFMLVQPFTVAENVVLGDERARGGWMSRRDAERGVAELAGRYRIGVDPAAVVSQLGVGQQQRVEILKVLRREARIIILDEPTAVLTPGEVEEFFATVRELRDSGKTVILITHKLREVMALADHLTVLRAGRAVAALTVADTTPEEIVRLMVGRDVVLPTLAVELKDLGRGVPPGETPPPGDGRKPGPGNETPERETAGAVLRIRDVSLPASGRGCALRGITLDVVPGEILGIAGVEGNGQSELVEAITGLRAPRTGSIGIAGTDVTGRPPRECFAAGLACIPEDRQRKALILDFSLRENLMLGRHREPGARARFSNAGAAAMLEEFTVRPPDPRAPVTQLSGGNQQKVVVAREFTRTARVLVAAQPTRGIDLGAIEFIHRRLLELRAQGMAILLVSAELTEILALSDRVAVMYGGRVVFEAPNRGLTERDLGAPMAGAGTEHAHG